MRLLMEGLSDVSDKAAQQEADRQRRDAELAEARLREEAFFERDRRAHIRTRALTEAVGQCEERVVRRGIAWNGTESNMIKLGEAPDDNLGTTHVGARISQEIDREKGYVLWDRIDYYAYGEGVEVRLPGGKKSFSHHSEDRAWRVNTPWFPNQVASLEAEGVFAQQVEFDRELQRLEAVVFPRVPEEQ